MKPSSRKPDKVAASPRDKLTPVMRQYQDAKATHPDAILFFRLGDFYEMFHDDAKLASSVLGITLTSRSKGAMEEVPMAGVPHHAAHSYVARLLAAGYKVALCEQLADPSKVKGIVPRGVVRVVTPGLVTDDGQLDARENHFLCAVDAIASTEVNAMPGGPPRGFGMALLDLSTGELSAGSVEGTAVITCELVRAMPREILLAPGAHDVADALRLALPGVAIRIEDALAEPPGTVISRVLGEGPARDAAALHGPLALAATARALWFAESCTPGSRLPVRRVAALDPAHTMRLDETAQAHLELVRALDGGRKGTLLETIDRTVTPQGARLLRQRLLAPLTDVGAIRARLDEVETFVVHARTRTELRAALGPVGDLERLSVRASLGDATPRDLGLLRDGLTAAPRATAAVTSLPEVERGFVAGADVDVVAEVCELLTRALVDRPPVHDRDGGMIADGYDAELDESRRLQRGGTELILALEASLRTETGAPSLRVRFTRVFGWYIEVTRSQLSKVPSSWRRKQTVAVGERYTNERLDQLAADIETAEDRALSREAELFRGLVAAVDRASDRIRALARTLGGWDVASALAEVAHVEDYAKPEVDDEALLDIVEGRHPVVEQHAARGRFVPNDTRLDVAEGRLFLVTGPNMAGKSTLMRQVALIVLLAQMGSYVPARRARVGIVDRLLSRVGASDNLARGESTFMVEMRETASILQHATKRSLVILDEIGRGTSTYDGLAIAWAVAEHLHDVIGCRALFATHYHELTELSKTAEHIVNVSVSAREHAGGVVFLHTLVQGPASRSYGIAVAKLAGLPESVVARAKALLGTFEGQGGALGGSGGVSAKGRRQTAQLGLFEPAPTDAERTAITTLRAVDVDRLTPLEAIGLLAKLRNSLLPKDQG